MAIFHNDADDLVLAMHIEEVDQIFMLYLFHDSCFFQRSELHIVYLQDILTLLVLPKVDLSILPLANFLQVFITFYHK